MAAYRGHDRQRHQIYIRKNKFQSEIQHECKNEQPLYTLAKITLTLSLTYEAKGRSTFVSQGLDCNSVVLMLMKCAVVYMDDPYASIYNFIHTHAPLCTLILILT